MTATSNNWLIVGLGNPGASYERTRHNLGFMLVDLLAREAQTQVKRDECRAVIGRAVIVDLATGARLVRILNVIVGVGGIAPIVGPLLGAVKAQPLPPGRASLVDRRRGSRRVLLAWLPAEDGGAP